MKKIFSLFLVIMIAATGLLIGCGTEKAKETNETKKTSEADGGKDWPKKLVVVQMPNEANPNAGTRHEAFRKALGEFLGIEIEEMEGTDYTVGIEAMANDKIDVMLVSPMSYYQAKNRAKAELLVSTPLAGEYRTVFITRADNDEINTLEDLRGHSFAFVDAASSSGYMYPKAKLVKDLNLDTTQLENSDYFFSTAAFSGSHDSSVSGVSLGDYDAAAVAGMTIDTMDKAGAIKKEDIKIIDQTELIPNPAYVVRGDLPEDLKAKIKEFYLSYDDEEYFNDVHSDPKMRFVDTAEEDYKIIYDTLEALNMKDVEGL